MIMNLSTPEKEKRREKKHLNHKVSNGVYALLVGQNKYMDSSE